ncbi:hypothetical protein ANO11243_094220 [Dothideomycetidae sp. 11243]|nr:hypothetical protein ANO11243_094220 [fungal sp. No.11243]
MLPPSLRKSDCIALVSPSARLNDAFPAAIIRAQQVLSDHGFRVKTIFEKLKPDQSYEDQALHRCDELHTAFRDPEVKAVMCTIGGSHANNLLRYLDYDLITTNPKVFVGYSDITNLHCAILAKTGMTTFYGPAALSELAEYSHPDTSTMDNLFRMISNETDTITAGPLPRSLEFSPALLAIFYGEKEGPRERRPSPGWKWLRNGQAQGQLLGGCLSSLLHVVGTVYCPDWSGRIMFIETAISDANRRNGPDISKVKEQMVDLMNHGVFDKIVGLVVGRPYGANYNDDAVQWKLYHDVLLDVTSEWSWSILAGIDIGHTSPMLTLPLNVPAELDSSTDRFEILRPDVV